MCKYSSTIQPRIERILMMVSYIWGVAGGAFLLRKEPLCSVRVYAPLRGGEGDQYWLPIGVILVAFRLPLSAGFKVCFVWAELYRMVK
jgi:hypothetical protein